MSYTISDQVALDPKVQEAPLRQCFGGPADGLSRRVPDGYVLTCALVATKEMRTIAMPLDTDGISPIDVCMSMGTYRGHYIVDGQRLTYVDNRQDADSVQ